MTLLESNTRLTEETERHAERVEAPTREIHPRIVSTG